jgi:poly-beta-1,6-N-acetyl-D-glucosamine synthase
LIECSVGVMAYDEGRNIGALLERLAAQRLEFVAIIEIIVVASGCSDGTESAVLEHASRNGRIRLVSEPQRSGKAAAINLFLRQATAPVCALVGADTLPAHDAIEKLVAPFAASDVGMAGARPIPLNAKNTFTGYIVNFLWELHHLVALRESKCGEMIAFRRVFDGIPEDTIVDEPQIDALIREAGLRVVYEPRAVVYNLGPDNLREILMRRRNIVAGYLRLARRTPKLARSRRLRLWLLGAVLARIARGEEPFFRVFGAMALELSARVLGWWDATFSRRSLHLWTPASSTKSPSECEIKENY